MSTNTQAVSARVQTYAFDNGSLTFSIDKERMEAEWTQAIGDALIDLALKTLIHRSSSRPEGKGEDATDWLLDELAGGTASSRFRVTDADKKRAKNALKSHKMAPEQTAKQFEDLYGIEFLTDEDALAKHYMRVRAEEAAAKKAKESML